MDRAKRPISANGERGQSLATKAGLVLPRESSRMAVAAVERGRLVTPADGGRTGRLDAGEIELTIAAGQSSRAEPPRVGFGTIKTELELVEYRTSAEALRELSGDIRHDHADRLHSSLGDVSPVQFETQHPLEK